MFKVSVSGFKVVGLPLLGLGFKACGLRCGSFNTYYTSMQLLRPAQTPLFRGDSIGSPHQKPRWQQHLDQSRNEAFRKEAFPNERSVQPPSPLRSWPLRNNRLRQVGPAYLQRRSPSRPQA